MNRLGAIFLGMVLLVLAACAAATSEQVEPTKPAAAAETEQATSAPTIESPAVPTPTESAAQTTTEPAVALDAFNDQLKAAVTNQDYAAMQALMNDPIGAGPWRSQWQTLLPAEMVAQFQGGALPEPFSVRFSDMSEEEFMILLDGQPPERMFGPDVTVAAVLLSSGWGPFASDDALLFVTEENGRYYWSAFLYANGRFSDANLEITSAPADTIYRVVDNGVYQIQADGSHRQLMVNAQMAANPSFEISPDGHHAAYLDEERRLWLVDNATGDQEQLAVDADLSYLVMWGDNQTLFSGVWLDPGEADGPSNGHMATIDISQDGRPLQILDETRLSGNPPALAADGETVAFDVYAASQGETNTGRIFNAGTGLAIFEPGDYAAANEIIEAPPFNPTWSPDGRLMTWFASAGDRVGMQVYDLDAQTAAQIFDWDPARFGGPIPSPIWSPDGQWLALEVLANGPEGSGIWLIAADGSSQTSIDSLGHAPFWVNDIQLLYSTANGPRLFDVNNDTMYRVELLPGSWILGVTSPAELPDAQEDFPVEETSSKVAITCLS